MSASNKFDCKNSFFREYIFHGNEGQINCPFHWSHATVTLKAPPKFIKGKAVINDIIDVGFNESIFPRYAISWTINDDKLDRKVQRLFDSVIEQGDPDSNDGRDKCLSESVIKKLSKLGFLLTSDTYYLDKNFKNAFTGKIVAEVVEID